MSNNLKISVLHHATSGLPANSDTTELWEELNEKQLKSVMGGTIEGEGGGVSTAYYIECYSILIAGGGVATVCQRVYTSIGDGRA
jgi:bacteriocin-like protein